MKNISRYQLGATIYMPSTRNDLFEFVSKDKIPDLKSMVICLEDSILEREVRIGLENIEKLLIKLGDNKQNKTLVFIRPRNINIAIELLKLKNIEKINGFVLPKFDNISFVSWLEIIKKSPNNFMFMPTLETSDLLDPHLAKSLCDKLIKYNIQNKILALRIGGNDLLSCLRLRRNTSNTIYSTPLNYIIGMFTSIFSTSGFYLTAPVYECFENYDILQEEFKIDLQYGLIGKTVIHPTQIKYIHEGLKVNNSDYESAKLIINKESKAVFKFNGAMCEPSTHYNWALEIIEREKYFGLKNDLK